jgi:hypothetical protein
MAASERADLGSLRCSTFLADAALQLCLQGGAAPRGDGCKASEFSVWAANNGNAIHSTVGFVSQQRHARDELGFIPQCRN